MIKVISEKQAEKELIKDIQSEASPDSHSLIHSLSLAFMNSFSDKTRLILYNYIKKHIEGPPSNGEPAHLWTLLLAAQPDLGAKEILIYLKENQHEYPLYIMQCLLGQDKLSKLIVPQLQSLLKSTSNHHERTQIWRLLLRADGPDLFDEYGKELDKNIKQFELSSNLRKGSLRKYDDSVQDLALVMLELDLPAVSEKIKTWIFDEKFEEWVQVSFLAYVVSHKHIQLKDLEKKWIKNQKNKSSIEYYRKKLNEFKLH